MNTLSLHGVPKGPLPSRTWPSIAQPSKRRVARQNPRYRPKAGKFMRKKPRTSSFCCFLSLVVIEAILAPPAEDNAQHDGHDDEESDPLGHDPCNVAGVEGRASVEVRCVCGRRSERCRCGGKWRCNEMRCWGAYCSLSYPSGFFMLLRS